MKKRNVKNELTSHFAQHGVKFGVKLAAMQRQLAKVMGQPRYDEHMQAWMKREKGLADSADVYGTLVNETEINLFFSPQSKAFLENSVWLTEHLHKLDSPPRVIVEFGCSVGALVSFLAKEFPKAEVVGIDREHHFCEIAKKSIDTRNATFHQWDYQFPKPPDVPIADAAVCSFGMDFPHKSVVKEPLNRGSLREGTRYESCKEHSASILRHWRSAVRDSGMLFTVLRLPDACSCVGFIDAAQEAGWRVDLRNCQRLEADGEKFGALVLVAESADRVSDDEVLGFWLSDELGSIFPLDTTVDDAFAFAVFQNILGKQILRSYDRTYADGHTMRCDVGIAGPFSFLYAHATTGYCKLRLDSRLKLEAQMARVVEHLKAPFKVTIHEDN